MVNGLFDGIAARRVGFWDPSKAAEKHKIGLLRDVRSGLMPKGTIVVEFLWPGSAIASQATPILSLTAPVDAPEQGRLALNVTAEHIVELVFLTENTSAIVKTAPQDIAAGDTVKVAYTWSDTGGAVLVDILGQDAFQTIQVPISLALDSGMSILAGEDLSPAPGAPTLVKSVELFDTDFVAGMSGGREAREMSDALNLSCYSDPETDDADGFADKAFPIDPQMPAPELVGQAMSDTGALVGATAAAEATVAGTICFTPGTLIATPRGEKPVEDLRQGDRVITRDNGIQEICWMGRRDLDNETLSRNAHLRPVLIRKGALGNGLPERDMTVSPNHRVLVANDKTALYFEEREVLVAAKHLTGVEGVDIVSPLGVSYLNMMFAQHEVVLSDGSWTESFQPGDESLLGIGNAQRTEIFELFPELKTPEGTVAYMSARKSLKRHEAKVILH